MFKPLSLSADKVVRDLQLRLADAETRLGAANFHIAEQNRALAMAYAVMRDDDRHDERLRIEALSLFRGAKK